MDSKIYNRNNFHKHTFCVFREVPFSEIQHLKPDYTSKSGSSYYFMPTGVYRKSNHWGRAANCKWRLQPLENNHKERTKIGFALWNEFHPDNDTEKLYFIEVNFENDAVVFSHKASADPTSTSVLRTASETTKRIKQIRNLLKDISWTAYFPQYDSETLKQKVIVALIHSDKTLQQIKSEI